MPLLNDDAQPAADAAPAELSNPLLREAEQKLEAGLNPSNRDDTMKVVVAGMHAAMSRGPDGLLAKLLKNPDPVKAAARGTVALILILRRETKQGEMPIKAMVPAGLILMFHALDLIEHSGLAKIGEAEIDRAAHIFTNDIFGAFNITPAMLARAAARVHEITQDPNSMQAIRLQAGVDRHPMAPTPTPMPGATP